MWAVLKASGKVGCSARRQVCATMSLAASSLLQLPMAGLLATLPPYATSLISNGLLFLLIGGMAGSCDAPLLKAKFTTPRDRAAAHPRRLVCQEVAATPRFYCTEIPPQSPPSAIALLVVTAFGTRWRLLRLLVLYSKCRSCFICPMTTASTLVAVVALPLNLALYITTLYGRTCTIDFPSRARVRRRGLCGHLQRLSTLAPLSASAQRRRALGQTAGVLQAIFGALANGSSHEPVWENSPDRWFGAVCLPVLGGLGIAMCLARLYACRHHRPSPSPSSAAIRTRALR